MRLVVADGEVERLAAWCIGDDDVAKADAAIGEIGLGLVAESTRDGPLDAKPDAASAGVEAEVAGDDVAFRIADEPTAKWGHGRAGLTTSRHHVLELRSTLTHGCRRSKPGRSALLKASNCAGSNSIFACARRRLGLVIAASAWRPTYRARWLRPVE